MEPCRRNYDDQIVPDTYNNYIDAWLQMQVGRSLAYPIYFYFFFSSSFGSAPRDGNAKGPVSPLR
jgi:hypothetical protein